MIDATGLDARARGAAAVLDGAPWLLAEGVLIAAGLRDSRKVELRLPAELTGREAAFLNAVDAIRSLAQVAAPRLQVEVQRNSRPSCWGEGQATDGSRLIHTPETWCRIALLFAGASDLDASLLTLRRGMKQRGLVELARSGNLRRQIDDWGGGVEVEGQDAVLVFDDGLGGFLPLSEADLSCEPLSLGVRGHRPGAVQPDGDGRGRVRRQADPARALSPLAARRRRSGAGARLAGARRAPGDRDHPRPRRARATSPPSTRWRSNSPRRGWRPPGRWAAPCATTASSGNSHVRRESCPEGLCLERNAAPCHRTCPANIDIPSFMAHLGHGDYRSTIEVIRRDNPLPLTCGLVCPAPCESACVRGGSNGAVFIRPMKAKAAEHCLADGGYPKPEMAPATGKRIGIVGSGPSGLTAAYYLRTFGHEVEIFEAQEQAGGMLRYGIPAYRLPPDLLEQEIDQIRVLGVAIHTGAQVASLEAFRKDYDAVFLGLGTQRARLIPIEGVHQPFVLGGIDFLRAVRSGEPVRVGPRVVVIGGGNVSIDVALTALRQGATARRPDLAREAPRHAGQPARDRARRRRRRAAAPGLGPAAHRRGWRGHLPVLRADVKDEAGRFDPKFDASRLLKLEADHVILATGQGTDLAILEGSGVENNRGFIVADPKTLMTSVPGVFAGGDGQHGPRTAVEAIRSGKIAAASIDAWLRGAPMDAATGTAGAPRRGDPADRRGARSHAPAPCRDAREGASKRCSARATTSGSRRA